MAGSVFAAAGEYSLALRAWDCTARGRVWQKRAKASKLTVNEFVRRAAEAYNPSDDDEALLRLVAQVKQTTHEATAALDAALKSCADSNRRIAEMEAAHAELERLCRYVSRPPVASERLALTASGQVRYTLKTPYRDGTTHIVLEPLDLMARLAALVPKPRMHLTRYHGVFAPHSQYRWAVTPAQRGRGAATPPVSGADPTKPSTPRHVAMSWARRLKRVFGVEIECCARCGGELKIIASIEEAQLIAKILSHLERAAPEQYQSELPLGARGPPLQPSLL
jgi:hypothetical protein